MFAKSGNTMGQIGANIAKTVFWCEITINIVALYMMLKPREFLAKMIPPDGRTEEQLLAKADDFFGVGGQAFLSWVSGVHHPKLSHASFTMHALHALAAAVLHCAPCVNASAHAC